MEELSNFFKEGSHLVNMKLVKSDKLLQNNSEVAGELNNFFKEARPRPVTLLKKRLWYRCFPVKFVKFLRTHFFMEHLWWLLLLY